MSAELDQAAIEAAVQRALPAIWLGRSPIISRAEAMAYVRIGSRSAWYRFCERTGLKPRPDNRYCRLALERAAEQEARALARAA